MRAMIAFDDRMASLPKDRQKKSAVRAYDTDDLKSRTSGCQSPLKRRGQCFRANCIQRPKKKGRAGEGAGTACPNAIIRGGPGTFRL